MYNNQYNLFLVVSRVVCNLKKGPLLPNLVLSVEDGKDNTLHAVRILEAGHGARSSTYLPKNSLNDIGGS